MSWLTCKECIRHDGLLCSLSLDSVCVTCSSSTVRYAKTRCQNNRRGRRILALWGRCPLLRGGACPSCRAASPFLARLSGPLPLALPAQHDSDSVPHDLICKCTEADAAAWSLHDDSKSPAPADRNHMQRSNFVCRLDLCEHEKQQED